MDPFAIDGGATPTAVTDSDGDGLTDQFEALLGTDPHQADSDHDGLSDAYETSISHTDPNSADTDHDGIPDSVEVARGTDPGHVDLSAAARAAGFGGLATLDSDHDGLSDAYEKQHGTDPFSADTDHDGLPDGVEVARGLDPLSADSNHDGLTDGFAAEHGLTDPWADGQHPRRPHRPPRRRARHPCRRSGGRPSALTAQTVAGRELGEDALTRPGHALSRELQRAVRQRRRGDLLPAGQRLQRDGPALPRSRALRQAEPGGRAVAGSTQQPVHLLLQMVRHLDEAPTQLIEQTNLHELVR